MSEHQSEPVSAEIGPVGIEPTPADSFAAEVESPKLAPDQEDTAPKADASRAESPKAESRKAEASRIEPVSASKVEHAKTEPRFPGKVMIMSPGARAWDGHAAGSTQQAEPVSAMPNKRRMSAMAAVVALATVAGALGGALALASFGNPARDDSAAISRNSALEAAVARIDADIVALKASVEHTAKVSTSQFNKTSDRLDKVEKAQAEPAAKLAKLGEAVEKLRATAAVAPAPAPVAAVAPVAAREVTGSISPPAQAAPATAPKPEVARLPTVEGWVLRDVARGGALIEGRQGIFEVYAGDPVPGIGRVDAIRKQDGRWVVVTSKGLIVAR